MYIKKRKCTPKQSKTKAAKISSISFTISSIFVVKFWFDFVLLFKTSHSKLNVSFTVDLAKFRNILKVLGNYVKGLFNVEQKLNLLWSTFYAIGKIFIAANGLILTNNLAIWSHCLYDRIDSPWTDKIKRFQINLSQKMVFFMMKLWVVWTHTSCHGGLVGTNCCPWLNLQTCFRHYLQTLESHKMWLSNKISHCKRS